MLGPINLSPSNNLYRTPTSNIHTQSNDPKGETHALGVVKLSASATGHSSKVGISLPSLIETQTLVLMHKQPEHLQASKENLKTLTDRVIKSACAVLDKLQEGGYTNLKEEVTNKMLEEITMLEGRFKGSEVATKSDIKACKNFSKHFTKAILDTIRGKVGDKNFKHFNFESVIKNELRMEFATELGKTEELWKPIEKKIEFESGIGTARCYESNMMPASHLPALADTYKSHGLFGVSSMSTQETRHAVNLWTTEFKGSDVAFKGVRHGVNMPFGEKDLQKQIDGANQRTNEVITAAADVKREAILEHIVKHGPGESFKLTIVSSSLLTPTEGLKYKKHEIGQQEAWQRAIQKSVDGKLFVNVLNENGDIQEVKVELDILPFSFGVNGFAKLESSAPIALKLSNLLPNADVSGWKWADKHNAPLFDKLLDSAREKAEEVKEVDEKKCERIQSYVTKIEDVIKSGKHHKDEGNAYALPILVSLLSNELGAVPAWNCMSGKDRTGYLDAKIKETLVLQDQLGDNKVLNQFSGMTQQQPEVLEKIIFESGSLEIQKACTGVAGYKVNEGRLKIMGKEIDLSVQSNRNNLRPEAAALLEGLSGAVKA